jgi:hypothetical protein
MRVNIKNLFLLVFIKGIFYLINFNSQKKSDEESRRAELKLEFWQLNDEKKRLEEQRIDLAEKSFGSCPTPIN